MEGRKSLNPGNFLEGRKVLSQNYKLLNWMKSISSRLNDSEWKSLLECLGNKCRNLKDRDRKKKTLNQS